ncbi:RFC checkpoint protein Rad17 [Coemansia sp. BCRC 34301]|nr:RFC checkpoint protein Rad17 [Coemansia sp. BCRC 34301]
MVPKTRSDASNGKTVDSVINISSRETTPTKCGGDNGSSDTDLDFDFEIDSDLEAFMNEFSQQSSIEHGKSIMEKPVESPPVSPLNSSQHMAKGSQGSMQSTARRRALTDRPKFKTARPASQPQPQMQQSEVATVKGTSFEDGADDRGELWWQRYEPRTLEDLALHARKAGQVRGWLEMAVDASLNGNRQGSGYFRILVLEGPAGACKSSCIRMLAHELCLNIVEWINPLANRTSTASSLDLDGDDEVSVVRQFGHFLAHAERYSGLALQPSTESGARRTCALTPKRQIILVDDLPNVSHRDTRESFRDALLRFSAVPAQHSFPMVIVVTESITSQQAFGDEGAGGMGRRFRETDKAANSDIAVWSAADVIPSAVYNSRYCQSIKFNPVAPTIVAKGLKRILQIRSGLCDQKIVKYSPATAAAIKAISNECQGDLRSAVTMLQLSMASHSNLLHSSTSNGKGSAEKRKRGVAAKPVCIGNTGGTASVSEARRVSLDLFHALGKVLYAKRGAPNSSNDNSGLARGRLESHPDEVLDKTPVDLSTFGLYVHENYADFCTSIDEIASAADCFSEADALCGEHRNLGASAGIADAYGALLTVCGYMHYKAHPQLVSDEEGITGRASSQQGRASMAAFRKPQFFDVYKRRVALARVWDDPAAAEMLGFGGSLLSAGATPRVLVQDILPFWAQIAPTREASLVQLRNPSVYQQLAELVAVGSHASASRLEDIIRQHTFGPPHPVLPPASVEKLVLSDDDIEEFSD